MFGSTKDQFADFYDCIVVIGHANDLKGVLSPIAVERISKGIELFIAGRAPYILLTSGRGQDFNPTAKPHSEWAKQELLKRLPLTPSRIFTESTSKSTIENAVFTKQIIDKNKWQKIIVVTSGYHIPRTRMIFRAVFPKTEYTLEFIKARTPGFGTWLAHRLKEILLRHRDRRILRQMRKDKQLP